MSASAKGSTGIVRADPYTLTVDGIKEPPVGWRASFRYLGPGLIMSASIVGSGELIATTNPAPARCSRGTRTRSTSSTSASVSPAACTTGGPTGSSRPGSSA